MKKNLPLLGRLALLSTAIIWGTSFVVLKNTLNDVGTLWVLAIRFTAATALMLALVRGRLRGVSRRCLKGSVLMGVALASAYIIQTYGLYYTTPGKNAFLTATYCVLTPFLAWLFYRRKPGLSNILAAVLCITGIGFVSLGTGFGAINRGDVLTLFSGLFYSLQIILMEQYIDSGEAAAISAVQFLTAAVICWAGALLFEKPPVDVPAAAWGSIAYLSVMCTGVCFFLQAWGMRYTPSSSAAMIMTLEAVFGALVSILFYHEVVTARVALGFALIFAAVVMSELRPFRGRKLA